MGTVPTKGWMILMTSEQRTIDGKTLPFNKYAIADRDSPARIPRVFLDDNYGDSTITAPGANAVCNIVAHAGQAVRALACWNLPSGSAMPIRADLTRYTLAQASANSPFVIAELWGFHFWNLLRITPDKLDAAVVDIRSGRKTGSLSPRTQHGNYASQTNIRNWFFQYGVSPNGDFLAEGGDGEIRLYRVP